MAKLLILIRSLGREGRGSSAAEFAMVLPLLLLFLLGIIDAGRMMWEWNRAQKATQAGVRVAVVTDMVPSALAAFKFTTVGITQGSPVPASQFPGIYCTGTASSSSCTCKGSCSFSVTASATAFNRIATRMNQLDPRITPDNVRVDYDYSGLGFAGNPYGPDVAPLVTVSLQNMQFTPISSQLLGATVGMPSFRATMPLEDGVGTQWN